MMAAPSIVVEAEIGGTWTDVSRDVLGSMRWERRMEGVDRPTDIMPRGGGWELALDNSDRNSAGLAGYYTPGDPNQRAGWKTDVRMRLRLAPGGGGTAEPWWGGAWGGPWGGGGGGSGGRYVFSGHVTDISPPAGRLPPLVRVKVEDYWARYMERIDELQLSLLESSDYQAAANALIAEMPRAPDNTWIDSGSETWPYVYDDVSSNETADSIARALVLSEGPPAFAAIRGDESSGETLRMAARDYILNTTVRETFLASDLIRSGDAVQVPSGTERIWNDFRVEYVPRAVGSSPEILVKLQSALGPITGSGGTLTRWADVTDPDQRAVKIGGKDPSTPLTDNTDFTANTAEDGSGTDITSDFDVTLTFLGTRAKLVITNNNASDGYLRGPGSDDGAEGRGTALRTFSAVAVLDDNDASVADFGQQKISIRMHYNSSASAAQSVIDQGLETWSGTGAVPRRIRPQVAIPEVLRRCIPLDIGDRISIIEDGTAVDTQVIIWGITCVIENSIIREYAFDTIPVLFSDPMIWNVDDWNAKAWGFG